MAIKTALVVDNSELMRAVIKDLLEENGVKIVGEASDPQQAIAEFERLKPDLVTLDMIMPGGSGLDALKTILVKNPKANVLVITESGRDSIDRQVQRMGARGLLHKPVSTKNLQSALQKVSTDHPYFQDAPRMGAAKPKVLIVDDSMVIRTMVRQIVTDASMEVVAEAGDVGPAIEAYNKHFPDLVILDLVMPGGTGVDVLKSIMAQGLKTKVLIATSVEQAKLNQELLQLGASAVLHKPFTPEELKRTINKSFAFEPAEPKSLADLSKDQVKGLEALYRSSADSCVQAMSKMTGKGWEMTEMQLRAGNTEEFRAIVDRIWKLRAIPVQIFVKKSVLVIGLVLSSKETAAKLAKAVMFNKSAEPDAEMVTSMLMEWTNILITAVLNVFANTMGKIILSSTPKILDWPAEDIIAKVPKELSDMPERILICHTKFKSREMNCECETMFFFRVDYVPQLLNT